MPYRTFSYGGKNVLILDFCYCCFRHKIYTANYLQQGGYDFIDVSLLDCISNCKGSTDFNNHFATSHVTLSLGGFLLSLIYHPVACRPILQCKVAHRLAERAHFYLTCNLLGVTEILQELLEPKSAIAKQQAYVTSS